jgi:hypothetical protein
MESEVPPLVGASICAKELDLLPLVYLDRLWDLLTTVGVG